MGRLSKLVNELQQVDMVTIARAQRTRFPPTGRAAEVVAAAIHAARRPAEAPTDGREESSRASSVQEILLDKVTVRRSSGTPGPSFIKALICGEATQSESVFVRRVQREAVTPSPLVTSFFFFWQNQPVAFQVRHWPHLPGLLVHRGARNLMVRVRLPPRGSLAHCGPQRPGANIGPAGPAAQK